MTHTIVVGLGFGDEGKGSAVDWLCATQDIHAVIRYNGGSQAAHNVVLPDGRHHTFAQFGSGTLRGVPTHLSQFMLVNPFNMVPEAEHLEELTGVDPFTMTTISEDALLITPYHREANRIREIERGVNRHGSCGEGVGETRAYYLGLDGLNKYWAPVVGDIRYPDLLLRKLNRLLEHYTELWPTLPWYNVPAPSDFVGMYAALEPRLRIVPSSYVETLVDGGDCVFEGAQGVLLDEVVGFYPYTTWTNTTADNAWTLLNGRDATVLGVTRTYHTRHGAGPFPTEFTDTYWDYPEAHNGVGEWQGSWRVGAMDLTLLDYAVRCVGRVDQLMITFCDVLDTTTGMTMETYWGYETLQHSYGSLDVPEDKYEAAKLTDILSDSSPQYNSIHSTIETLTHTIEGAAGYQRYPTIYSYGPTAEDKHADVLTTS